MLKAVKILLEVLGWFAIAGGTTIIAAMFSLLYYTGFKNDYVALGIVAVGFVVGAVWATRIGLKYGTVEWLSTIRRIS